jgi:hypothetical protein
MQPEVPNIFCLFTPTDEQLRRRVCGGDAGKDDVLGSSSYLPSWPGVTPTNAGNIPPIARSPQTLPSIRNQRDDRRGFQSTSLRQVSGRGRAHHGETRRRFPVIVHHKFIVIDAETDSPVIYTGSANMSGNSVFNNDENLLEVKGSPRLAQIYLAEFLRLYEHYRARARFIKFKQSGQPAPQAGFALQPDRRWADKHYTPGSAEFQARLDVECGLRYEVAHVSANDNENIQGFDCSSPRCCNSFRGDSEHVVAYSLTADNI